MMTTFFHCALDGIQYKFNEFFLNHFYQIINNVLQNVKINSFDEPVKGYFYDFI